MDDAQQRPDRKASSDLKPGLELLPGPAIHADLAASTALPVAHENSSTSGVEISLGKVKRLSDA